MIPFSLSTGAFEFHGFGFDGGSLDRLINHRA